MSGEAMEIENEETEVTENEGSEVSMPTASQQQDAQGWTQLLDTQGSLPSSLVQSLPLGQERREKGEEKPEKEEGVEQLLEVWLEEEQRLVGSRIGSQLESLPQSHDEVDMEDEDEKDEEAEDDLTMPATPNTSQESLPPGQGTPFTAVVPASRKEPPDQPAELDADRIANRQEHVLTQANRQTNLADRGSLLKNQPSQWAGFP